MSTIDEDFHQLLSNVIDLKIKILTQLNARDSQINYLTAVGRIGGIIDEQFIKDNDNDIWAAARKLQENKSNIT